MHRTVPIGLALILFWLHPLSVPAATELDTLPRWEAGVGGGYFAGFDYPASDDPNRRSIALPWFVYRAPILRAGGGGLQAVAIENARIKLDLSIGGSLSASTEGNQVREGMPDLDYLLELGPQLTVVLDSRQHPRIGRTRLSWNTRLRAVISTDFGGVDARGYALRSGLRWQQREIAGSLVDLVLNLDATVATERLHDYFYEVPEEFATVERPRYDATGGYLGSTLFAGLAWRPHANWRLFTGVVTGWYDAAANRDSPLFESDGNTGYVLGIAWTVFKSADTVEILDSD